MIRMKYLRLEQDKPQLPVCEAAKIKRGDLVLAEHGRLNLRPDELKRLAKALNWRGDPGCLTDHIASDMLQEGAEYRMAVRDGE